MLAIVSILLTWLTYYTYPLDGPPGILVNMLFLSIKPPFPKKMHRSRKGESESKRKGDEDPVPRAQNSSRNRSREANMEAPSRDPGKADSKVVRDAQTWEHGGQHHRNCPLAGCREREKAGIPVVWRGISGQGIRILTQTHWVGGDGRQTGG